MNRVSQQDISKNISSIFPSQILIQGEYDPAITGMNLDSRKIKKHELFVAKPGGKFDGRDFIDDAVANGAAVVLSEQAESINETFTLHKTGCPIYFLKNVDGALGQLAQKFFETDFKKLKVIGVTGTNGKTSICHYLAQALSECAYKVALLGTNGNGFFEELESSELTTLDVLNVHKKLSFFYKHSADYVCMEVSSHALDQHRVSGIEFSHTVFTNLTQDHLDYHGDMASYAKVKERLFHLPGVRYAVINQDETGLGFIKNIPKEVSVYGLGNDLKNLSSQYLRFNLNVSFEFEGSYYQVSNPYLMGDFNAENIALCFLALVQLGVDERKACELLSKVKPAQGRMQQVLGFEDAPAVYIDFAHTPDALEKALSLLKILSPSKIILVFGCGGSRDVGKRSLMAKVAERFADTIIVTSDNPRDEAQSEITENIVSGFSPNFLNKVAVEENRQHAIEQAIKKAKSNDVVLIAGKGHENYQIFSNETIAFDDVEVASQILASLYKKESLQ
jgi:UDP-N-acetylmuramoyl-L-alanyl-D-glutamate--2,6-diaminopimelate ligase